MVSIVLTPLSMDNFLKDHQGITFQALTAEIVTPEVTSHLSESVLQGIRDMLNIAEEQRVQNSPNDPFLDPYYVQAIRQHLTRVMGHDSVARAS